MKNSGGRFLLVTIGRVLGLIGSSARMKVVAYTGFQILLSLLDLIGIGLIGVITLLATQKYGSQNSNAITQFVLNLLGLEKLPMETSIRYLGVLAVCFLIGRTVLSVVVIKRSFLFLARESARISYDLASKFLNQTIQEVRVFPSQKMSYALTQGVERATIGLIGTAITLAADIALTLILFIGLLFVDFYTAVSTLLYFLAIGYLLHKQSSKKAKEIAANLSSLYIKGNEQIIEAVSNYRDIFVRHRIAYSLKVFGDNRASSTEISARMSFVPYVGKYVVEGAMIVGSLFLATALSFSKNGAGAVTTLSVFLAASARIAPAILRIQQGLLQASYSAGLAKDVFEIQDLLSKNSSTIPILANHEIPDLFTPEISISNLCFQFRNTKQFQLNIEKLQISEGQLVAIVGPSGSGKSTFVDLILGILSPTSGVIAVSGMSPHQVPGAFPGVIGYVPQEVVISNGTLRDNVAIGFDPEEVDDARILDCLFKAQLGDFIQHLPHGIDTGVGEWGQNLSGGQRQRLGIARALYTSPKLIVLDEATSALDAETENLLSKDIDELRNKATILIVAHRLATVRAADLVLYFENGRIIAEGSFNEVRRLVPNFDTQAKLLGL